MEKDFKLQTPSICMEKIEELLKSEKLKVLKPNECGLIYDEKRDLLIGICNKDGKIEVTFKKKIGEI
jgi:hypothetical protein